MSASPLDSAPLRRLTDRMKRSDRRGKAFDYTADSIRQLMTFAIGLVGFTVTFSKDFASGVPEAIKWIAFFGWLVLTLSAGAGLWALQALAGQMDQTPRTVDQKGATSNNVVQKDLASEGVEQKDSTSKGVDQQGSTSQAEPLKRPWSAPTIWASPVVTLWKLQWRLFAFGLGLMLVFGCCGLNARSDKDVAPAQPKDPDFLLGATDFQKILSIGPFPGASNSLTDASWAAAEDSVVLEVSRRRISASIQAIVLVGGVDRRSLALAGSFSTNASLAAARAEAFRSRLLRRFRDSIAVFAVPGGALMPDQIAGDVAMAHDRRVDVYLQTSYVRRAPR